MADDYDFKTGPTPIQYTIPLATLTYMMRLNERGLVEGPLGNQNLSPSVEPLVWALHHLLAGGEIKVEITRKGDPDVVRQLEKLVEEAHKASNEINEKAGYYVTLLI